MHFSVIIPVYNKENHISKTILSALNQTMGDFELIIVNDGSTDKSLQILQALSDKRTDKKIVVIDKRHEGVSTARNIGIDNATGKYISFLDADDIWDSRYLETMQKLIAAFPLASFFGCQYAINSNGCVTIANETHNTRGYVNNYFLESIRSPLVCTSSIIVKRECFDQVGIFNPDLARGEDIEMWIRLARKFKLAFEPTLLSFYIQDSDNRACNVHFPLDKYFLVFNLKRYDIEERRYLLKLGAIIMTEMLYNKRWADLTTLIFKYRFNSVIILYAIISRKLRRSNNY